MKSCSWFMRARAYVCVCVSLVLSLWEHQASVWPYLICELRCHTLQWTVQAMEGSLHWSSSVFYWSRFFFVHRDCSRSNTIIISGRSRHLVYCELALLRVEEREMKWKCNEQANTYMLTKNIHKEAVSRFWGHRMQNSGTTRLSHFKSSFKWGRGLHLSFPVLWRIDCCILRSPLYPKIHCASVMVGFVFGGHRAK